MNLSTTASRASLALSVLFYSMPAAAQSSGVTRLSGGQLRIITRTSTSSTDTITQTDCGRLISYSNSSAIAASLPAATSLLSGCWMDVENIGPGTLTITPVASLIDGAPSISLTTNQGVFIVDSGTQYLTGRGQGAGSSGNASSPYSADGTTLNLTGSMFSVDTAAIASRVTAAQGIDSTCVFTSGSPSTYVGAVKGNALAAYADGMILRVEIDATTGGGAITANCGPGPVPVYQNGATSQAQSNPTTAQWGGGTIQTVVFHGAINSGGNPPGAFVLQGGSAATFVAKEVWYPVAHLYDSTAYNLNSWATSASVGSTSSYQSSALFGGAAILRSANGDTVQLNLVVPDSATGTIKIRPFTTWDTGGGLGTGVQTLTLNYSCFVPGATALFSSPSWTPLAASLAYTYPLSGPGSQSTGVVLSYTGSYTCAAGNLLELQIMRNPGEALGAGSGYTAFYGAFVTLY